MLWLNHSDASILYVCWFESQLLPFQDSSLSMYLGKRQQMAKIYATHMEDLHGAPGSCLAQTWSLWTFE